MSSWRKRAEQDGIIDEEPRQRGHEPVSKCSSPWFTPCWLTLSHNLA
jgi:hypothetical protein